MKPELTGLSVLTTLCGYYLGSEGSFSVSRFVMVALSTLLVGGGLGALNQYLERHYDALMRRTEKRPLPDGRLLPSEALWFGVIILVAGIGLMTIAVNILSGVLASLIACSYLFLYTPLKRVTTWSTLVGAVPGALPPVMGWAAARGEISAGGWALFAILFLWQMPHFYSLAWMYRKDYARAGFEMLTVNDEGALQTGRQIMLCTLVLIPVSVTLSIAGVTGWMYSLLAVLLGGAFASYSYLMFRHSGASKNSSIVKVNHYSRQLFFASLLYLPALMTMMIVDKK
jgi:protoheme IX farnesyltransferase